MAPRLGLLEAACHQRAERVCIQYIDLIVLIVFALYMIHMHTCMHACIHTYLTCRHPYIHTFMHTTQGWRVKALSVAVWILEHQHSLD